MLLEVSLMNLILRISKEIKWKVKFMLLEETLMNFILRNSSEIKWKVEVFTRSIIDEPNSSDIQGDQMEGESGIPRSIVDELHCSVIQGDQMHG